MNRQYWLVLERYYNQSEVDKNYQFFLKVLEYYWQNIKEDRTLNAISLGIVFLILSEKVNNQKLSNSIYFSLTGLIQGGIILDKQEKISLKQLFMMLKLIGGSNHKKISLIQKLLGLEINMDYVDQWPSNFKWSSNFEKVRFDKGIEDIDQKIILFPKSQNLMVLICLALKDPYQILDLFQPNIGDKIKGQPLKQQPIKLPQQQIKKTLQKSPYSSSKQSDPYNQQRYIMENGKLLIISPLDKIVEIIGKDTNKEYQNFIRFTKCSKDKIYCNRMNQNFYHNHQYGDEAIDDFCQIVIQCGKLYPEASNVLGEDQKEQFKEKLHKKFGSSNTATDQQRAKFILNRYTYLVNFYKPLNIALRTFKKPEDLAYLRLPIKQMYKAIQYYYKQMSEQPTQYCYRGCRISYQQLKQLEDNQNQYVQLLGFISTSKSLQSIKYFKQIGKNDRGLQLKIKLPTTCQPNHCPGFADISKVSYFQNQEEILLNSKNIFKVVKVTHKYDHQFIELELINNIQPNADPQEHNRMRQLQLFIQNQQIEQKRVIEQGTIFKEVGPISKYTEYYERLIYIRAEKCSDKKQSIINSLKHIHQKWRQLNQNQQKIKDNYLASLNEPELIESIHQYAKAKFIEKHYLLALILLKIYLSNVRRFKLLDQNSEQILIVRSQMMKCKIFGYKYEDIFEDDIKIIKGWLESNKDKVGHECQINLIYDLLLYYIRVNKNKDQAVKLQSRLIKIMENQFLNMAEKINIKIMLTKYYNEMEKNLRQERYFLDCILEYYQLIQGQTNINIQNIHFDYAFNCNLSANFRHGKEHLNQCQKIIEKFDINNDNYHFLLLQRVSAINCLGLGDVDSAKLWIETFRTTFMPDQIDPNRLQYPVILCPILQVTGEYEEMVKEQITEEEKVIKKNLPEIFYKRAEELKNLQFIFYSSYFMAASKYYVYKDHQWKQYLQKSFQYGKEVLMKFEGRLNHYYTQIFCWGIRLYVESGNLEEADNMVTYLKDIIQNNDIYMVEFIKPLISQEEGVIELKKNKFQEAIQHLQNSLNGLQSWQTYHYLRAEILLHLGLAEFKAGKRGQAQNHAKQGLKIREKAFKNVKNGKKIKQAQELLQRIREGRED